MQCCETTNLFCSQILWVGSWKWQVSAPQHLRPHLGDSVAAGDLTAGAGTICRLASLTCLEAEDGFQLVLQLG